MIMTDKNDVNIRELTNLAGWGPIPLLHLFLSKNRINDEVV